jgi:uncharacterized membrane protein (DUF4010 family)
MVNVVDGLLPRQVLDLCLVLFLAFLVGIGREDHKAHATHYVFGGVRTFPLLALVGYGLARLTDGNVVSLAIGLAVVGALMSISYWHKVHADGNAGAATEVSGLLTYLIGALVYAQAYWIAVSLGVVAVLLLELREGLERLSARVNRDEVTSFAKFLVLAAVILPILPDRPLTRFEIDPFRTWLVIVAVSGVSYVGYVAQRALEERGGVLVTALLGGAYSSTVTTIVLARRAKASAAPRLYAGSMLAASGMMYLRMLVLICVFDRALAARLAPVFVVLALAAIGAGVLLAARSQPVAGAASAAVAATKNPLELRSAFLFGGVFLVTLVLTRLATDHIGRAGLYGLAGLMGLSDVDPFVLGIAQSSPTAEPLHVAAAAIAIAASANNLVKGVYARAFADRETGTLALRALALLAAAGLAQLFWV